MTKEEIRGEIAVVLCHIDGRYWNDLTVEEASDYIKKTERVCIRVDRELPSIKEVFPLGGVPKEFAKGLEYYRCFLMGTDYVSVKPII